jgi:hypothetical protein
MAASVYDAQAPVSVADLERTAFRRAEKKYKLYKFPLPKSRSNSSINLSPRLEKKEKRNTKPDSF